MKKRNLLALLVLAFASLACGRPLEKWEMTPEAIPPPVTDLTLHVCVTAEDGARFTNRQGVIDIIPKGTKVIDGERIGEPLGNQWAELYYEGESILVLMSTLGICQEEQKDP